jgi:DNA invertase Pin-like site-specific DNA recombinase
VTSQATIRQPPAGVSPRGGTPSPRCCLYLRASSTKKTSTRDGEEYRQRPEIQEERLRQLCTQRGWRVVGVYCDRASGRKETRPELTRLMQDARRGLFDVVAVAAFDRFARSVKHLVTALDEFRTLGIDFVSLREAIDTSTAAGRLLYQLTAAFAEFESALISERTTAAMEYTKLHGTRSGRTVGRQRRIFDRAKAAELLDAGRSYREVARILGVPVGTLHAALGNYRSETGTPQVADSPEEEPAPKEGDSNV